MSYSDGASTSKTKKADSAAPVSPDFWDQFVRDWGLQKYIGNVYSVFIWATGIRDLAIRLLTYIQISRDTEEQEEQILSHVLKLEPLIQWFDEWMYKCIEIPLMIDGTVNRRKIGFYHLRRQNVMPINYEMRVILEGFTYPVANADYSEMRAYALYGKWENGKRVGGVKNICNMLEAHFHHIIKVKQMKPLVFEDETMDIGDENHNQDMKDVVKLTEKEKINNEVDRLRRMVLSDDL